uniref:Uncharacterized protein n=1 Tax=Anguilla anguilla TaxID=7936 RepID=A0A0E9QL72_ANGAN
MEIATLAARYCTTSVYLCIHNIALLSPHIKLPSDHREMKLSLFSSTLKRHCFL